jgi:hypothetical protein
VQANLRPQVPAIRRRSRSSIAALGVAKPPGANETAFPATTGPNQQTSMPFGRMGPTKGGAALNG